MPINSRNKGASFERQVANILNEFFERNGIDFRTKRNLVQYQEKDLCDLDIPFTRLTVNHIKKANGLSPHGGIKFAVPVMGRYPP